MSEIGELDEEVGAPMTVPGFGDCCPPSWLCAELFRCSVVRCVPLAAGWALLACRKALQKSLYEMINGTEIRYISGFVESVRKPTGELTARERTSTGTPCMK